MTDKVYEIITDQVVKSLQEGTVPWRKPWDAADAPRSIDGHRYTGLNVFLLLVQEYKSKIWMTFNAMKKHGGNLKPNQHGTIITFWKMIDGIDKETGESRKFAYLRYYKVYNLDQTENVDVPARVTEVKESEFSPIESAESILAGYPDGPTVNHSGSAAYYKSNTDTVTLPPKKSFPDVNRYYSTAFHELGHSTGHESRLNRPGVVEFDHFGSAKYGREELIAEMTAAFLNGESGILPETIEQNSAYIAGWIRTIQEDTKAVVTAAAAAQRAANYILNRSAQDTVASDDKELVTA